MDRVLCSVYGICTSLDETAFTLLWLALQFFPTWSQRSTLGGLSQGLAWDLGCDHPPVCYIFLQQDLAYSSHSPTLLNINIPRASAVWMPSICWRGSSEQAVFTFVFEDEVGGRGKYLDVNFLSFCQRQATGYFLMHNQLTGHHRTEERWSAVYSQGPFTFDFWYKDAALETVAPSPSSVLCLHVLYSVRPAQNVLFNVNHIRLCPYIYISSWKGLGTW